MNGEYRSQTEYKEIDLIDYIKVIIKSKKLILILLLIGLIVGGALALNVFSESYRASSYLEIGVYGKRLDKSDKMIIDSMQLDTDEVVITPVKLTKKINSGFYVNGVQAKTSRGTNIVEIEILGKTPQEAKNNLENVNQAIIEEHNQKIETRKEILEKNIKDLENRVSFLLSRDKEVEMLELEIYNIQNQLLDFQLTQVIKEPEIVSEEKIGLFSSLIFGGILGIFVGICLAFGKEWWKKNKDRL